MSSLSLPEYQRYGRQMILDGFGLSGQIKLKAASVVVVGAGGLGCPALQYLGAAGIGRLGIVDHDRVEVSNLQRQILHNEETVGMYKAESAALALKRVNAELTVDVHPVMLDASNALSLLSSYDIILDCTDNLPVRYLLSDAAVALNKPLVSGAAQKFEGQLCVYNLGDEGPCYRCLYPVPPPPETVGSCSELGILGAVTGVIGNMQALETIKIILGLHNPTPTLLLFSALGMSPFRTIKLRARKPTCPACSPAARSLAGTDGLTASTDYVQFCGGPAPDWVDAGLSPGIAGYRVNPDALADAIASEKRNDAAADARKTSKNKAYRIIDVRPPTEFGICSLPGSENIPLKQVLANPSQVLSGGTSLNPTESLQDTPKDVFVVCRLGNDSQTAAQALRKAAVSLAQTLRPTTNPERTADESPDDGISTNDTAAEQPSSTIQVMDVVGGLRGWSLHVDKGFPMY